MTRIRFMMDPLLLAQSFNHGVGAKESVCWCRQGASASGPVATDLNAGRCGLSRDQLEGPRLAIGGEQGLAASEGDWLDHEHEFVDQLGSQQCPQQRQAAV